MRRDVCCAWRQVANPACHCLVRIISTICYGPMTMRKHRGLSGMSTAGMAYCMEIILRRIMHWRAWSFPNGVFATLETGHLSAMYRGKRGGCTDNRLTAYCTHGYAWCDTNGAWGMFSPQTNGEALTGQGETWALQSPSLQPTFASLSLHRAATARLIDARKFILRI